MTPFLSAYPVAPREYQPTPRGYQSPAFDLLLLPTFTSQLHRKYKKMLRENKKTLDMTRQEAKQIVLSQCAREKIDTLKLNHTLWKK